MLTVTVVFRQSDDSNSTETRRLRCNTDSELFTGITPTSVCLKIEMNHLQLFDEQRYILSLWLIP
jgi:hypothetical protein